MMMMINMKTMQLSKHVFGQYNKTDYERIM